VNYDIEKLITTVFELKIEIRHHVKEYEIIECVFMIHLRKVMKHLKKYGVNGIKYFLIKHYQQGGQGMTTQQLG